jgi:hypothetical protein
MPCPYAAVRHDTWQVMSYSSSVFRRWECHSLRMMVAWTTVRLLVTLVLMSRTMSPAMITTPAVGNACYSSSIGPCRAMMVAYDGMECSLGFAYLKKSHQGISRST